MASANAALPPSCRGAPTTSTPNWIAQGDAPNRRTTCGTEVSLDVIIIVEGPEDEDDEDIAVARGRLVLALAPNTGTGIIGLRAGAIATSSSPTCTKPMESLEPLDPLVGASISGGISS
jgi:hypothetical protein